MTSQLWTGTLTATALVLGAGSLHAVYADEDDEKLRDLQPAVKGPIWRAGPDPWKLRDVRAYGAAPGTPDGPFQSQNIALKAWIPLNNFPGYSGATQQSGADCWGYTSPSGREYALIGLGWGTGVVEVTNPSNPSIITVIPGSNTLWHDVDVIGQYAYAVSDSSGVGIQVIDLRQIDSGNVTLVRNYSQGGHTTTHTAIANPASGYLYLCGANVANGGLVPVATSPDPTLPTFAGSGWTTRYVHEAHIRTYTAGPYAGREIAFLFTGSSSNGSITILDVTNKSNLVNLATIVYPGRSYSHQGWVSDDGRYLYHNDEIDGPSQNVPRMLTRVFDIADLTLPRLVSVFTNGLPSVDHNEYVHGRYLYQSNYTTGLRVWDLTNPLRPVEVAWIDTHPDNNGTGYNGAWGNYPYFSSGTILISDIQRGLFVVRLSLLEFDPPAAPTALTPGGRTPVSVRVAGREAQVRQVALVVSTNGSSETAWPMTPQSGDVYTGEFPAFACHDRVRYYFRATTTDGRTFTWPLTADAGDRLVAHVQTDETVLFADNFETDRGWTVQNDPSLTAGAWVRAVPLANGGPGAVIGDADGSGRCFVTGNTLNADVDGGPTRLISPVFNLSQHPEARIRYARWLLTIVGANDPLTTEISNDNGATWVPVHSVSPASGAWEWTSFRVADYVTPTAAVRVRFSVADDGNDSTTEAGVDAFSVISPQCQGCYANCDGSTTAPVLNVADFTCFLTRFAAGEPYANCDRSTSPPVLNVADFTCFLQAFAAGCP